MARTKKQDEVDERKQEIVLCNARTAAAGEIPFGYTSVMDWHKTTMAFYSDLFKDEEFAAEFEAIWGSRAEPIVSLQAPAKTTPPGSGTHGRKRSPKEDEAREYLKEYRGSFEFLNDLKLKFLVQHPSWTMSEKQVAAVLKCKLRDSEANERKMDIGRPKNNGPAITEDGIYDLDGEVYKVQRAVHGSGRLYAKRLNVATTSFEYEAGAIFNLRPEHKMTLEQAKAFGKLYGVCCNCGRTLTDEGSIAEGIGPICAGKEWF